MTLNTLGENLFGLQQALHAVRAFPSVRCCSKSWCIHHPAQRRRHRHRHHGHSKQHGIYIAGSPVANGSMWPLLPSRCTGQVRITCREPPAPPGEAEAIPRSAVSVALTAAKLICDRQNAGNRANSCNGIVPPAFEVSE